MPQWKQYGYLIEKSTMIRYTSNLVSSSVYLHTPCYFKLGAPRLLDEVWSFSLVQVWYRVGWMWYIIRLYNVRSAMIYNFLTFAGILTGKYSPENPPTGPRSRIYTPEFLTRVRLVKHYENPLPLSSKCIVDILLCRAAPTSAEQNQRNRRGLQ